MTFLEDATHENDLMSGLRGIVKNVVFQIEFWLRKVIQYDPLIINNQIWKWYHEWSKRPVYKVLFMGYLSCKILLKQITFACTLFTILKLKLCYEWSLSYCVKIRWTENLSWFHVSTSKAGEVILTCCAKALAFSTHNLLPQQITGRELTDSRPLIGCGHKSCVQSFAWLVRVGEVE